MKHSQKIVPTLIFAGILAVLPACSSGSDAKNEKADNTEHAGNSEHTGKAEHSGEDKHSASTEHSGDGEHAGKAEHAGDGEHADSTEGKESAAVEPADKEVVENVSTWAEGDAIPSGKTNVPDCVILTVHKNGSGDVCGTGKRASLKYKAMKADGSVLDPGTRPFTFRVGAGEAIKGWDVIVAQMRIGDSFTITVPQQLAYGPSRGDLKFDMELLSVQ